MLVRALSERKSMDLVEKNVRTKLRIIKNKITFKERKDRGVKRERICQKKLDEMWRKCLVNDVELKTRTM